MAMLRKDLRLFCIRTRCIDNINFSWPQNGREVFTPRPLLRVHDPEVFFHSPFPHFPRIHSFLLQFSHHRNVLGVNDVLREEGIRRSHQENRRNSSLYRTGVSFMLFFLIYYTF